MQGGVLKALETCSGGQAGGVSAQDSGRLLFGMAPVSSKQYQCTRGSCV